MTRVDKAKALFQEGYNCSQSVVGAYIEEINMDMEVAMALASSFGGGMGRLREVCGAVTGMFMVAGILYGYSNPKDNQGKKLHYERIQELAKEFEEKNGSIVCRVLLGLDHEKDEPNPSPRNQEYYKKRPCIDLVGDAVLILEEYIKNNPYEVIYGTS